MQYRQEIDGLRALAVVPVMLFHAGFSLFAGGFVGVDVFFVISGYLITSILLEEHSRGSFSIWRFYERRVRRILPALYFVMLVCLPIAWLLMLPDDLENFGQSLVATTLFANNVLLWLTSNYFQLEAEFKPLLHTWSLAVEEQYYLVFPPLLALCWRLGRRPLFVLFTVLGLFSLALAEAGWRLAPEANFYLIPSRAWELMAGALVALHLQGRSDVAGNGVLAAAGLALILLAIILFDSTTPFPGLWALLPVVGTVLYIRFAQPTTLAARLLSLRPVVFIGLISYSLYLWHQPVLAFMRITRLEEPGALEALLCLALTGVLAWLSWRYVEAPFRSRERVGLRSLYLWAALFSAGFVAAGLYLHLSGGRAHAWPELMDAQGQVQIGTGVNAAYNLRPLTYEADGFEATEGLAVLVVGDSFARDFINAGLEQDYFAGKRLVYRPHNSLCDLGGDDAAFSRLVAAADVLVFTGSQPAAMASCIPGSMKQLDLARQQVLVIGTKNFGWNNNAVMLLPPQTRYSFHVRPLAKVSVGNALLREALAPFPHVAFVDVMGLLADDDGKVPVFTPDKKFISQDREHYTRAGARYVGAVMLESQAVSAIFADSP